MADTTSLIITTEDSSQKKIQKSVTGINPDAQDADLLQYGRLFSSLSTNNYLSTYRVDKYDLSGPSKTARTLSAEFNVESPTVGNIKSKYSSQSGLMLTVNDNDTTASGQYLVSTGETQLFVDSTRMSTSDGFYIKNSTLNPGVITIYAPETDNYTSATTTITITE